MTVTISPQPAGAPVPADFLGMSFGTRTVLPDNTGGHFFSPTNTPLVTLFQNLGIRHLRLGGTSVEWPPGTPMPDERDIDSLFAFVKTARVRKVIYSLRLLETNSAQNYAVADAGVAKYVWDKYRPALDCFAIGNEPDRRNVYTNEVAITNFESYLRKWRQFAAAVTNAVPKAKFAGPDAGSGNTYWTTNFARAQKDSGLVEVITEHFYVGGAGRGKSVERGLEAMLSPAAIAANERLYHRMAEPVLAEGFPLRFTEANDHFSGGVRHASDTFAGALWALDFLHWWAAHGASGVNFHNTQWVVNDVITRDASGGLVINPKGYGLRAFEVGSHGRIEPVMISNADGLNLTAYAVRGEREHLVTLINKEHGSNAREANVTLAFPGTGAGASALYLTAGSGDAAAKTGVTLGGASINADGPWLGKWERLSASRLGQYTVRVPAVSAAVVRIPAQ